ncbi:MAG: cysteine desulfurase family protein [Sphaerochaetaceae bacterium]
MRSVYLDNNATTQMAEEVIQAMQNSMRLYGNASSMHQFGREAAAAIETARLQVAQMIGADSEEIIFTSGGTESNNAVLSYARDMIDSGSQRKRIITSTIEHPAIIEACRHLVNNGYTVDYVPVDVTGRIDMDHYRRLLSDDVLLVSIMAGNNEIGTIQDIVEFTRLAHESGALMHTDAVQAIGKMDVDVKAWNVDYLSLSAHKFYGSQRGRRSLCEKRDSFWSFCQRGATKRKANGPAPTAQLPLLGWEQPQL